MAQRTASAISLASAVYGFVVLGAILFGLSSAYLMYETIERVRSSALEEAVNVRGHYAARDFARVLEGDWRELKYIAGKIRGPDAIPVDVALDLVIGSDQRISWAGFATPDGLVQASSNDMLKGVDVSARPWFQRGFGGDFAGDVHEAVLLNQLLGGTEQNPLRFIDLASKVETPDGQIAGVLGFHINFAWAEAFLAELAQNLELDLFLVSQNGEVIIATDGSEPGPRGGQIFRAATSGVAQSGSDIWPDGQTYFNVVIPDVTYGDLPSFGWRMVARIDPEAFAFGSEGLLRSVVATLTVAGLLLLVATVAFSRIFIQPFALLADNAKRIADGADEYPLELRRTDELVRLSAALAQLQGKKD
jgi:hypothetical protein